MTDSLNNVLQQTDSFFNDYMLWFFVLLFLGLSILYLRRRYHIFSLISEKLNVPKRLMYIIKFFLLAIVLYYLIWNPVVSSIINKDYLKLIISAFFIVIMFRQFQDLISGLLIFFNKNYPIGLAIAYKDYVGKISDINLFSVLLKLDDGNNLFIPSNEFINNIILDKSNHANENKIEFLINIPEKLDQNALEFAKNAALCSNYLDYKANNEYLLVESKNDSNRTVVKFIVYAINSSYKERLKSNIIEKTNKKMMQNEIN